jgi:hypothetical protein
MAVAARKKRTMTKDEMSSVLARELAKFRTWSYAQLAERVERDRVAHDCLEHIEGTAPDGTKYYIEFNAFWDDKPQGDVRVIGSLGAEPQKPLLGFIPIYISDVNDSFIMSPDGRESAQQRTHSP